MPKALHRVADGCPALTAGPHPPGRSSTAPCLSPHSGVSPHDTTRTARWLCSVCCWFAFPSFNTALQGAWMKPFVPGLGRLPGALSTQPEAQSPPAPPQARSVRPSARVSLASGSPPRAVQGGCAGRPSHVRGQGDTWDPSQRRESSELARSQERRQPVMKEGQAIDTGGAEVSPPHDGDHQRGLWVPGQREPHPPPERGQLGGGQADEAPRPALPGKSAGLRKGVCLLPPPPIP